MIFRHTIPVLFSAALSSIAQTNIDSIIKSSDLAGGYASMINFAAEPDISAAKLNIEDDATVGDNTLRVIKFPLRHEFELKEHGWKPVIQGTLSRFSLESEFPLFTNETVKTEWTAYSASLGGGARIPLSTRWSIMPAADVGYAYLRNEAAYGPVGDALLKPLLAGKLFDWEAHTWMLNTHLTLFYEQQLRSLELDARLSGTASHIESFKTTSDLQQFRETIGTVSIKANATYPLGFAIWNSPVYGVAHYGHSTLYSEEGTDFGFTSLNEAGFSFKADIGHHGLPVKSLSLGSMVLWGNAVSGWKILTAYRF